MHLRRVVLKPETYPRRTRYPFDLPALRGTTCVDLDSPVTLLVGANGSGKTTFLEAVTTRAGIHIWRGEDRTRFDASPHERELWRYLDLEWTAGPCVGAHFASTLFRNFAQLVDEWASTDPGVIERFGGASLLTQSHGQSIMSFLRARLALGGIYFLDEPETALSPTTQLELRDLLAAVARRPDTQLVVATHSPILLSCPGARILSFDRAPVGVVEYTDTEHYRVYRRIFGGP